MGTVPRSPTTIRITSGSAVRGGIQSITVTSPSSVSNLVSRTRLGPRYRRVTRRTGTDGATSHRPWSGVPRRPAKQAPESNRGKHSQSIDPSRETRAAVCVSPISA
jgi:hypothetical protein